MLSNSIVTRIASNCEQINSKLRNTVLKSCFYCVCSDMKLTNQNWINKTINNVCNMYLIFDG